MAVRYDGGALGSFAFPITNPRNQVQYFEDFNSQFIAAADTEYFVVTQQTNGTFALLADGSFQHAGIGHLSAANATDGQGANLQFLTCHLEPDEAGDYMFEARVRFSTNGSTNSVTDEMFVGLAQQQTTDLINSSDVIVSNKQYIGLTTTALECDSGHGTLIACDGTTKKAAGSSAVKLDTSANGGVGVSDFARIAISVRSGVATLWVNGEKKGTVESNLPSSAVMVPTFVAQSNGTQAEMYIDYMMAVFGRSSTAK
mgnify:CR=1 FL=1